MIDEVNELYDPLLDDLDTDTLMKGNMDSESVSKNRVWGVKVENPTQKKQGTMVTQERPGTQGKYKVAGVCTTNKSFYDYWETPGEVQSSGCSCHEQAVSMTTGVSFIWMNMLHTHATTIVFHSLHFMLFRTA